MTKKQHQEVVEKINQMREEFDERLDNIERVLILQEENLKVHMARSNHLETIVEKIKETDIKPIARHVVVVETVFKILGIAITAIGVLAGAIASVYSFFS
jgi:phenylalanyl-tRNA synthetase alpha subunit